MSLKANSRQASPGFTQRQLPPWDKRGLSDPPENEGSTEQPKTTQNTTTPTNLHPSTPEPGTHTAGKGIQACLLKTQGSPRYFPERKS